MLLAEIVMSDILEVTVNSDVVAGVDVITFEVIVSTAFPHCCKTNLSHPLANSVAHQSPIGASQQ